MSVTRQAKTGLTRRTVLAARNDLGVAWEATHIIARYWRPYDGGAPLEAWLATYAPKKARTLQKRYALPHLNLLGSLDLEVEAKYERQWDNLAQDIETAMSELPNRRRLEIEGIMHGDTMAHIGKSFGITRQAVAQSVSDTLETLRRRMTAMGWGPNDVARAE